MTKRLLVDIVITLALVVVLSWLTLLSVNMVGLCPFKECSSFRSYGIVSLLSSALVIGSFAWTQYRKTHNRIQPKRRKLVLETAQKTFQSAFNAVLDAGAPPDEYQERVESLLTEYGWVLDYSDGSKTIVYQRNFYHWLLDVASIQENLEKQGKERTKSPLGQRLHGKIGRERLRTYKTLLDKVNALEYVNGNVVRLKADCAADPWATVIYELNKILQLEEV